MTSISLCGAYEHTDPDHPALRFGHPKDRRPDLKQVGAMVPAAGPDALWPLVTGSP